MENDQVDHAWILCVLEGKTKTHRSLATRRHTIGSQQRETGINKRYAPIKFITHCLCLTVD